VSDDNAIFIVFSGLRAAGDRWSPETLLVGAVGLLVLNVVLWALCYSLLRSGWKIKN
jgi:ABC-2 type transport system permease protein